MYFDKGKGGICTQFHPLDAKKARSTTIVPYDMRESGPLGIFFLNDTEKAP